MPLMASLGVAMTTYLSAAGSGFRMGFTTIKPTLDNLKAIKPGISWSKEGVYFRWSPYENPDESDTEKADEINRALNTPYIFKPRPPEKVKN